MYKTTTIPVLLHSDREGQVSEHVRIHIEVAKKDSITKTYTIETRDVMVLNKGTNSEAETPLLNRYGNPQTKIYFKTYAEFDAEKEYLMQQFPSELSGSDLDDYLLLKGLEISLMTNPVYVTASQWE